MSIYQSTKVSPYVYQLTHKTSGQFYIGYREINEVPSDQDLGFFYFTSSDKVDELCFENFNFQIIAEFFDGDSAWYQEQRIIEANIKNPLCLNGFYIKDGKKKFKRTGPHSKETKLKISNGITGIKRSEESIKRMKIAQSGKDLNGEKNPFYGKIHSTDTLKKISDSKKAANLTGEKNPKSIAITINGIHYVSKIEARRLLSISRKQLDGLLIGKLIKPRCKSLEK